MMSGALLGTMGSLSVYGVAFIASRPGDGTEGTEGYPEFSWARQNGHRLA